MTLKRYVYLIYFSSIKLTGEKLIRYKLLEVVYQKML